MSTTTYSTSHDPLKERAVLVGVHPTDAKARTTDDADSLHELSRLAETAGADVVDLEEYRVRRYDAGYFLPRSRVDSLKETSRDTAADCVIFDSGLSPAQQRNLEESLDRKVLDRQQLILDIFAGRARTAEGKVQVELAQLKYLLPRLRGMWKHLERQAGGIGTRGPGEKQIESDRRKIIERIARLERQIERIRHHRDVQRRRRQRNKVPTVSLIGYTNAGKSTLLNALTASDVLAENKLFATLDPTTRACELPGGTIATLTDTVGFINKLPPTLAAAFRATLEEIRYADLLLQVVDATSHNIERDLKTTKEALEGLGIADKPIITVWNKIDRLEDPVQARAFELEEQPSVAVSATTGQGLDTLKAMIEHELATRAHELTLFLRHDEYGVLARLHEKGRVDHIEYVEGGMHVDVALPAYLAQEMESRAIAPSRDNEDASPNGHGHAHRGAA